MSPVVEFDSRYFDSIAAGHKVVTVRWDDPIAVGPALFVFAGDDQHRTLNGVVTGVTHCALGDLTEQLIQVDRGSSVAEYIAGLHDRYTAMPPDAVVDVVTFVVV